MTSTREQVDLQHLTRVRALTAEIAAAISAIEHNNLPALQASVANQERICSDLASCKWTPSNVASKRTNRTGVTSGTAWQVRSAYEGLAQINRVYAGVVKRSKRSVDLLAALYRNQGDSYGQGPRPDKVQSLSCEV